MTIETKEALLNGASMFIEPCEYSHEENDEYPHYIRDEEDTWHSYIHIVDLIDEHTPYQINQKLIIDNKEIGTIKSVKVVKVQDICGEQYKNIMNTEFIEIIDRFINWYNKQYNNYDQNTYVFLYEVAK